MKEPHTEAKQLWYSNVHPRPPTSSPPHLRKSKSSPIIIHTTYNGHPIDATVVKVSPTSTINGITTNRQKNEESQITEAPASQHHMETSIIPGYGNHTLFHTNRWRINNTTTSLEQILSPPYDTGVDLCLRACIEEPKCAFAGYTQRDGALGPKYLLYKTCSLYPSDVGAERLEATNVDEKRILGPDFLAIVGDRVAKDTLMEFLKNGKWWTNKELEE